MEGGGQNVEGLGVNQYDGEIIEPPVEIGFVNKRMGETVVLHYTFFIRYNGLNKSMSYMYMFQCEHAH